MVVGFHSPLPPARTGIADYSATLLDGLRAQGSVEIGAAKADVQLYHIGNNILHWDIYQRALSEPGIVVLHDALLQHLFMSALDEAEYVAEFVFNYGEWSRDLAVDLWRGRASSGLRRAYYEYPMLKRLVEQSRAVIVHNPAAARIVRAHAPDTPIVEIPLLFGEPLRPIERKRLDVAYVFGILGYLRESKRIMTTIRAFEKVRAVRPATALLLAGQGVSPDLNRAIGSMLNKPGILRLGHMTESEFWGAAWATDACVNLRYPSAGESSMIEIQFMGIGKPVLVSSGEETARYPEGACLRVDSGPAEEEMLTEYMLSLRLLPELGATIGRRAKEHIRCRHSVEHVARLYWETLCAYSRPV